MQSVMWLVMTSLLMLSLLPIRTGRVWANRFNAWIQNRLGNVERVFWRWVYRMQSYVSTPRAVIWFFISNVSTHRNTRGDLPKKRRITASGPDSSLLYWSSFFFSSFFVDSWIKRLLISSTVGMLRFSFSRLNCSSNVVYDWPLLFSQCFMFRAHCNGECWRRICRLGTIFNFF